MNLFLKIGKLLAILILTVFVILLSASFLLKDKVGFIILKSLNRNLSTKLDVRSYRLSFLRKFPKASLDLKDVVVHSSAGFDADSFKGINTDTLLYAHFVSVQFRLSDIFKGVYDIERIGARNGRANFFIDASGHVNYNITFKSNNKESGETNISLERINLEDIKAYYNSLSTHLIINWLIKSGRLKSRITGNNIDFTGSSELQIRNLQLYNFLIDKPIDTKLDVNLLSSKSGILLRKTILHIDNYELAVDGFVSTDNILDLNLEERNLNIAKIRNYLPEKYLRLVADYNPSGIMDVKSTIKGPLNHTASPHIEINWKLNNGRIIYKKSSLILKDLTFSGHLGNGSENGRKTSSVTISDFKARLGSSDYTGTATMNSFIDPVIDLSLKGRVFPAEVKEFFNLKEISAAEGSVDMELRLNKSRWTNKSFTLNDFIDLKPEGAMTFNSLTIGFQNNKFLCSEVKGIMVIKNSIMAHNLQFNYKGQNIKIDGEFRNLPEWLTGRPVKMIAKANVSFDRLIPQAFFSEPNNSKKSVPGRRAVSLPGDLLLDINFRIDSLAYKTFSSSKIEGTLNYQPKILTFKTLQMHSLNGIISGNSFFAQNSNKSIMAKGSFIVTGIDVNRAFTTFHNFGQSFLKAENIKGTLSGSLTLLLPLDSLLNYKMNTLTAEGKYHLVNGALINFDPVKQLSSFIELSELQNISFEQLDNDFFIRSNYLYVPQMEVNSSAADLSVNGKHSFDNEYEYHVKILLSQILSKKRHKNKSNINEFGVVEDDGLGRTSLLLKILGKGENAKVSYDMKAAGSEVKNDIKKEKQSLKTILNQEYGWYKKDTTLNKSRPEKKPKFKIKWDDGDSSSGESDPPSVRSPLN